MRAEADGGQDRLQAPSRERVSSYAIAAFVLATFAIYKQGFALHPFDIALADVVRHIVPMIVAPLGASLTALWLSRQADAEIDRSRGTLSGSALARAGRVLAIIALVSVPLGAVVQIVFRERIDERRSGAQSVVVFEPPTTAP